MPEFVYALHDFSPENDDEVPFRVGERIQVIATDEIYEDGWWQGRNPQGKVGLFPQVYTSPNPPKPSTIGFPEPLTASSSNDTSTTLGSTPLNVLQPLTEESEAPTSRDPTTTHTPVTEPAAEDGRERTLSQGDEMMKATITDVQKAIEQLGRTDGDGARSFSFASSHGDYTDRSEADTEADTDEDVDGLGWHKDARQKLAMRAQQENEERLAREAAESGPTTPVRRSLVPPIDVELSDESEAEDDDDRHLRSADRRHSDDLQYRRQHPHIPEEDEENEGDAVESPKPLSTVPVPPVPQPNPTIAPTPARSDTGSSGIIPSEDFIVPLPNEVEADLATATADKTQFQLSVVDSAELSPKPNVFPLPTPTSTHPSTESTSNDNTPAQSTSYLPTVSNPVPPFVISLPTASTAGSTVKAVERASVGSSSTLPSPSVSSFGSVALSPMKVQQTITPDTTASSVNKPSLPLQETASPASTQESSKKVKPPSEWDVDEVVEWLKSKGFDQSVCDKFVEQEITGDVLLELDANILKSEIGIAAFGKRVRIANAIAELRRPPSTEHLTNPTNNNNLANHISPSTTAPAPLPVSRTHSIAYSHSHSASLQSSTHHSHTNSPIGGGPNGNGTGAPSFLGPGFSPTFPHPPLAASSSSHTSTPSVHLASPGYNNLNYNYNYNHNYGNVVSPESAPHTGDIVGSSPVGGGAGMARSGWRTSDPGSVTMNGERDIQGVGLGLGLPSSSPSSPAGLPFANGKASKNRPAHLVLSPSEGALKAKAVGSDAALDEDRVVLSDSEAAHPQNAKSKRRHLFGRSTDSSSFKEKASSLKEKASSHKTSSVDRLSISRDLSTPVSISPSELKDFKDEPVEESPPPAARRRHSKKGSTDERKASDRLSLFGGTFSGTLGKSRKPPPKVSTGMEKTESDKSSSMSTFSRLRHHNDKKSPRRPSTSDGSTRSSSWARSLEPPSTSPIKEIKPRDGKDPGGGGVLRKRTSSTTDSLTGRPGLATVTQGASGPVLKPGKSILEQIGAPDHNGWMRKKGDRYNAWKLRYFVLKGPHLYCLRSNSVSETKIKGYVNIVGYKVLADENVDPGRYGFRIVHDTDKTHYFSSDEQVVVREWMKALIKATISRDYTNPVMSSSNIPTIPLTVAQAMNPAPRPPSPTARAATQRAHRRENPNQLSSRDAQVLLMGLPAKEKAANGNGTGGERGRLDSFFTNDTVSVNGGEEAAKKSAARSSAPLRPSREARRFTGSNTDDAPVDVGLIEWANSHLPRSLQITDPAGSLCSGLALLRLAEDVKGSPCQPAVPDSAFPSGPQDDKLDGLFRLFDFLLDNDVKMGSVSINDIRQGKKEKVLQLLRALRAWEEKRRVIAQSIGKGSVSSGAFMALTGPLTAPIDFRLA